MEHITVPDQVDEAPSEEATEQLATAIQDTLDHVLDYRARAEEIDAAFERAHEDRRLTLDDMPFGEELIRTESLPAQLRCAASLLPDAESVTAETYNTARAAVVEALEIVADCTELPLVPDEG